MDPVTLGIVGGTLLGGLKDFIGGRAKQKQYKENQLLNARKAATLPWLGLKPVDMAQPDMASEILGGAIGGGLTGASMGQGMEMGDLQKKLLEAKIKNMSLPVEG